MPENKKKKYDWIGLAIFGGILYIGLTPLLKKLFGVSANTAYILSTIIFSVYSMYEIRSV